MDIYWEYNVCQGLYTIIWDYNLFKIFLMGVLRRIRQIRVLDGVICYRWLQ